MVTVAFLITFIIFNAKTFGFNIFSGRLKIALCTASRTWTPADHFLSIRESAPSAMQLRLSSIKSLLRNWQFGTFQKRSQFDLSIVSLIKTLFEKDFIFCVLSIKNPRRTSCYFTRILEHFCEIFTFSTRLENLLEVRE